MKILLGDRLRDLREAKNVKQYEVAKSVGCSPHMISNYELNKREPDLSTVVKLCDYYAVSADCLLGRSGKITYNSPVPFTDEVETFLRHFSKLSGTNRKELLHIAKLYHSEHTQNG